jgi:hypothetical protein
MLAVLVIMICLSAYFSYTLHLTGSKKNQHNIIPPTTASVPVKQPEAKPLVVPETHVSTPAEIRLSPNATIVTQKYFTKCSHTTQTTSTIPQDMVNLTQEEITLAYKDWQIKSFEPTKVVLIRKFNAKCPTHYILKDKDGFIAIYYQMPVNGIDLKEVTTINISRLSKTDQEKIKEEIYIESDKELARILEDLNS